MDARKRWRYAISFSVALNIFLLCGAGILSAGLFTAMPVEQIIELELVSEDTNQQVTGSEVTQTNASGQTPMQSSSSATLSPSHPSSSSSVAVQTVTALSVDEVSSDFTANHDRSGEQEQSSAAGASSVGSSIVSAGGRSSTGQGTSKGSGGIIGPTILSQVYPDYPESTRQAGITGTVILKVQILENGRAGDVSIKKSSGNSLLDDSAVTAVYKWHFTPAKERNTGQAVTCYTTVPVSFRLN